MNPARVLVLFLALAATPAHALTPWSPPPPAFEARGAFIALNVPDLDASAFWYMKSFGMQQSRRESAGDGIAFAVLEGGGLTIELVQHAAATPPATAPALGPFKAGVVVADFDATLATLQARGVPIAFGPFPARDGQRANAIVRDPDGNLIQFFGARPTAADDRAAIAAASRAFSDATVHNDSAALMRVYTQDAWLLPPNRTVRGREDIARYFRWGEGFRQLAHAMTSEDLVVDGDLAIDAGTWSSTNQNGDAPPTTLSGRYLVVWERGADGAWRMRHDMWHRPPSPAK
jgi:ketosteroid isomerase-like protein/catechol 2,3-dioxygenase-like lactoylglutathione lyase family enzyme